MSRSNNPGAQAPRFGLMRVRSPLLAQSQLISPPRGTEMFHFPRCRSENLCIRLSVMHDEMHRVAPFGNPRIKGYVPLPAAYRSLSRPSSPRDAKASVVRPYTLGRRLGGPGPFLARSTLQCNSSSQTMQLSKIEPVRGRANRFACLGLLQDWWACLESNQGPRPYQGRALTN